MYNINIHRITLIIYTYLWNTPTYHSLHINVVNLSIINVKLHQIPRIVISRGKVASHYAWHIISPYSNLPLYASYTQENHGKPFSYRHQNCNLPSRETSSEQGHPVNTHLSHICPEPLWRQKPKWAATPTPGLILTHTIHVWYIYLHLPYKSTIHGW